MAHRTACIDVCDDWHDIQNRRVVYVSARPESRASGVSQRYDGCFDGRIWPVLGQERVNYFSEDELRCQHSGEYKFDKTVLKILNAIRKEFGPMPVTSGYRCPEHPIEARKDRVGAHTTGKAVDLSLIHI